MTRVFRIARDQTIAIDAEFAAAVIEGLSRPQKTLPCRYFYDARGSELFEQITRLPEYYPARTETAILRDHAAEMAAPVPEGGVLVEFGSGSSRKTEILLAAAPQLSAYVPIDVSDSALSDARARLAARFPALDVRPVVGDFSGRIELPRDIADRHRTGFFPGSTIGNLAPADARQLLRSMRRTLSDGARLIVGVDLKKDAGTLVPAYDDADGVTAAFNLNLLTRINRELLSSFDLGAFSHRAIYNADEGRIEMHLVSARSQTVQILEHAIRFAPGETIHTENSYKYSVAQFRQLAADAGWSPQRVWLDRNEWFSVHELTAR